MKILICDLNIKLDGHKFGFIQNLIYFISRSSQSDSFLFLINNSEDFKFSIPEKSPVEILLITTDEQKDSDQQKSYFSKSRFQWKLIESYATKLKIDRLILMELDPYQLFLGLSNTKFEIRGIWFRPYHRMATESKSLKGIVTHQINMIKKRLTFKVALCNHSLDKVFVLNDESLPNLNHKRVFYLPDPCFDYPIDQSFDLRKHYEIPPNNLILLQFGFIDERKNTENIIAAINRMPDSDAAKVTLLIIGKFKTTYLSEILNLNNKDSKFQLICRDEFISDAEMESTFAQSDIILRMNVNFYGSSGVVGIAANHHKPCIVSDFGVMAEQVEKYKMGYIINPFDLESLKNCILGYLHSPKSFKIDGSYYKKAHSLDAFAKTLL